MPFSMRLNEADEKLIKTYADFHGVSMAEFMRQAAIEKIEDEYDLKAWHEAKAEYEANPVSHSHQEVKEMLGLK